MPDVMDLMTPACPAVVPQRSGNMTLVPTGPAGDLTHLTHPTEAEVQERVHNRAHVISGSLSQVWEIWNSTLTTNPWPRWCFDSWSSSTTTINVHASTWEGWCAGEPTALSSSNGCTNLEAQSAEAREALARAAAEAQAAARKRDRERTEAQRKAREILLRHLEPRQREQLERERKFTVTSQEGEIFVVRQGRAGNVERLKDGKPVERLCIVPQDHEVPDEDAMLVQLLMLRHDPGALKKVANRTILTEDMLRAPPGALARA